jgi:hypothetical protein
MLQIAHTQDVTELLQAADVAIYTILGHEKAVISAAIHLANVWWDACITFQQQHDPFNCSSRNYQDLGAIIHNNLKMLALWLLAVPADTWS